LNGKTLGDNTNVPKKKIKFVNESLIVCKIVFDFELEQQVRNLKENSKGYVKEIFFVFLSSLQLHVVALVSPATIFIVFLL
jgi:hypothetical protein